MKASKRNRERVELSVRVSLIRFSNVSFGINTLDVHILGGFGVMEIDCNDRELIESGREARESEEENASWGFGK